MYSYVDSNASWLHELKTTESPLERKGMKMKRIPIYSMLLFAILSCTEYDGESNENGVDGGNRGENDGDTSYVVKGLESEIDAVFPHIPVVMPDEDGDTLAIFMVGGGTATRLASLEGSRVNTNHAEAQLSPDGRFVACLRTRGDTLRPVIEVIDIKDSRKRIIAEDPIDTSNGGAGTGSRPTSLVWMDDQHILYSRVKWPSRMTQASRQDVGATSIAGEVWMSDLQGEEQRLVARGPLFRVLGATSRGDSLYVTYLISGRETEREEGFAVIDMASGEMTPLWPAEDGEGLHYRDFKLAILADGTIRILFVAAGRGDRTATAPPTIWSGDPDSGQAERIGVVEQGRTVAERDLTIYDLPTDILLSPSSKKKVVYLTGGMAAGGIWQLDTETEKSTLLNAPEIRGVDGARLLAWTPGGLVVKDRDTLRLLDENGETQGEIRFRESDKTAVASLHASTVVVDREVPYIHQRYDTPDWFDGSWACGPTSAVMAVAYYHQLSPHPITVSYPQSHTSDYGWYVSTDSCGSGTCGYTQTAACEGVTVFSQTKPTPSLPAAGAYGACMNESGYADSGLIKDYARKHDVGGYLTSNAGEVTPDSVRAELDGGAVVVLGTDLTGSGHIVLVRGYTTDGLFIVNDPAGDKHLGYWNSNGAGVRYTWSEMSPNWYLALYGPEQLSYLYESSSCDSTITVHNGAPDGWLPADVEVCLMENNGLRNTKRSASVPAKASWNLPLSDVFSLFSGSAVIMRNQTGVSTIVQRQQSDGVTFYNATRGGGGDPGWGRVGEALYVPVVKNNYYSRSSTISVLNTSSNTARVNVSYYRRDNGALQGTQSFVMSPHARSDASSAAYCASGNSYFCSAVITSDAGQPLSAVVREFNTDGTSPATLNASTAGGHFNYVPVVKRDWYGQTTGLAVFNPGSSSVSVSVTYYRRDSTNTYNNSSTIPGHGTVILRVPDNAGAFIGSATVRSSSAAQKIVTAVYESGDGKYKADNAFANDGAVVSVPGLNTTSGHTSGVTVQNVGDAATNVTIRYYGTNGAMVQTINHANLASNKMHVFSTGTGEIPTNFSGSAVVFADQPIAVTIHRAFPGSGDTHATYSGILY